MDRLRWDNIARAAALLGVIALVAAWPHLRRHGPTLPSAVATPVSVGEAAPVAPKRRPRPRVVRKRAKPVRRVRHRGEGHASPRRAEPVRRVGHRGEARVSPRRRAPPPVALPPKSLPPAPPSPDDQAAREFALP